MPYAASGSTSRMAATARPWDSSRWCVARAASAWSRTPGAWMPPPWPSQAAHHGSLWVAQRFTRSPSAACTPSAYST